MPYAWTHIVFGHELLKKTKYPELENKNLFQLGCQGPDFFFFYRFWSIRKNRCACRLGSLFHTANCGPVLVDFITAAKNKPHLREYILGFVTHHILDRNTHPFIHYRAGYKPFKHQKLEVIIDALVAKEIAQIETWKTPLAPNIDIGGEFPQDLLDLFQHTKAKYYPTACEDFDDKDFNRAYQDIKNFFAICFDPTGIKRILTLGLISFFRHSNTVPPRDFLNLKKTTWHHPALPDETYQTSFWDHWEDAIQEGTEILGSIQEYWAQETDNTEALLQLIQNISYDSGKDCNQNLKNIYAKPLV